MLTPWARVTGKAFATALIQRCVALGWPSDYAAWLMACIAFESGCTFSASVINRAGSGAVGLIQFMPATAADMKTSVNLLAKMTAVDQLEYVYRYFKPYAARIRSLGDMYMGILLPHYIGMSGDAVLFSGGTAYRENSGLDENTDGQITKDEAVDRVRLLLAEGWEPGNRDFI